MPIYIHAVTSADNMQFLIVHRHKVKFPDHEYKMQQYTGNTMGSKSKIPGYISPLIKFPDFALKYSHFFPIPDLSRTGIIF